MKRKNKIRIFWGSIALILALIVSSQMTIASTEHDFITITIHSGDTLWSIAQEYTLNENQDIRKTIDEIKKLNDMSGSNLIAGQTLKIPQ